MLGEELFGVEVCATRMSRSSHELHLARHVAIGRFALHRPARKIWRPVPEFDATWAGIAMAAQCALIRLFFVLVRVKVVRKELLRHSNVEIGRASCRERVYGWWG